MKYTMVHKAAFIRPFSFLRHQFSSHFTVQTIIMIACCGLHHLSCVETI